MDTIKNLNYTADEINNILAAVELKATTSDIESLQKEINDLSELVGVRTTLEAYGITDAKIENGVITLGDNKITPATSDELKETNDEVDSLKKDLEALTTQVDVLQNVVDILIAPSGTFLDFDGSVLETKDDEYFTTK